MKISKMVSSLVGLFALTFVQTTFAVSGPVNVSSYAADLTVVMAGGAAAPTDGSIFVQLSAGANSSSLTPVLTISAAFPTGTLINTFGPDAPYFDFGYAYTGVPDLTQGSFRIDAWQATVGNPGTFDAANVRGSLSWDQATGTTPAGSPPPPPSGAADLTFGGAHQLVLTAVPEPSTIALGIMGGVALLARRRRD